MVKFVNDLAAADNYDAFSRVIHGSMLSENEQIRMHERAKVATMLDDIQYQEIVDFYESEEEE